MLVLRFDEPHVLALRISGTIQNQSWYELESQVRQALATAKGRRVVADLGDLNVDDECGIRLIRYFLAEGIEFSVVPEEIAAMLDEVVSDDCAVRCNRVQRALFRIGRGARLAPMAIRLWVCNVLSAVLPSEFVLRRLKASKICER